MSATATQEQPVVAFKPPVPKVNQDVSYFRNSVTNDAPFRAIVLAVNNENIKVMLQDPSRVGSEVINGVRHAGDPKLQANAHIRALGCWDFTDQHKADERNHKLLSERLNAMEKRLERLESRGK